jgi:hypothetical protein
LNHGTIEPWNNLLFQQGQIVLILVLITVVGLTIGLSLVSRTITDVRISSQIEQSNRAFSAAEAGVESALKGAVIGGPTGTVSLANASAKYNVTALGGGSNVFNFPLTETYNVQTLWLIAHKNDGTVDESASYPPSTNNYPPNLSFDVCWGSGTSNPAVIISLYYKDGSNYKVAKGAYDGDPSSRTPANNFYSADTGGSYCGGNYKYRKTLTPSSDLGVSNPAAKLIMLRIQPIYDNTQIAIAPATGESFPIQGKIITSIGQTNTGLARKIQVNQSYQVLPSLLDFTVFSESEN